MERLLADVPRVERDGERGVERGVER
jgi:hypothetical protein